MSTPALSQRGDIRLGYRCNARCGFCYYLDSLDNPVEKEPKTQELRARIRRLRESGATELEFTGGEPTIRPDLAELVRYAASLGFVNISMITNGLRLAKRTYADALIDAGVNDFLFSIHGHTAALHDEHTSLPGSFARITAAVRNVQARGVRCRSSTTVTGRNFEHMTAIVGFLAALPVDCMNLAVFSPVTQARGADERMHVRYWDAAAAIKQAIDAHREHLPPLSVKYIPFCFMRGYEQYVMNLYQQSFDPDDWNYYLGNMVRRTRNRPEQLAFDALVLAGALIAKDRSAARGNGVAALKVLGFTRIVELLRKQRVSACRSCRYDVVCDHAWRSYVKRYGDAEFEPVPGETVLDPAWCYDVARSRVAGVRVAATRRAAPSESVEDAAVGSG